MIPRWKGSLPNIDVVYEPIEFVNRFLDDELLSSIVEETNLYSTQKNPNKPLNVTMQEIRNFIGIVYMMSVYKLPATRMYWNNTTRIERIATVMTCNRWEAIKNHLHFNNNDTIPPDNIDKLFKIRPLLSSLLTKFQSTPIDEHLSLDEQIVPFKGKSSLKQYNPNKPKKWGYKIFVLSDYKGIVYNFQIYDGPLLAMPGNKDIGASGNIVMQLASVIPKNQGHKLYFDSWFTSVNLQVELEKIGSIALEQYVETA